MDVPERYGADPRASLEKMRSRIRKKLEEEIGPLNGIKFQLALKVQLRKTGLDGTEECTDPVFRHKQEVIHQTSEIDGASGMSVVGHSPVSAPKRSPLHSTTRSCKKQEGGH